MKVMDDMWSRMKGYGEPEIDAYGFYELDTGRDDGVGVCRNIAPDFAKKMNEINPNFNARTIYVTMDPMYSYSVDENYTEPIHEGLVDGMDIVYVVDTEHEDVSENTEVTEDGISSNVHVNITGNHEIVFLTIDDMIIAVDPTNLDNMLMVRLYSLMILVVEIRLSLMEKKHLLHICKCLLKRLVFFKTI